MESAANCLSYLQCKGLVGEVEHPEPVVAGKPVLSAAFPPPKSIRRLHVGFMLTRHWPRGIVVTRLYEKGSLALSLIRSSGETRAHRSPSARPAFLTVCRLLYSADSFHSASPAEFCSAYMSPTCSDSPSQHRFTFRKSRPLDYSHARSNPS